MSLEASSEIPSTWRECWINAKQLTALTRSVSKDLVVLDGLTTNAETWEERLTCLVDMGTKPELATLEPS